MLCMMGFPKELFARAFHRLVKRGDSFGFVLDFPLSLFFILFLVLLYPCRLHVEQSLFNPPTLLLNVPPDWPILIVQLSIGGLQALLHWNTERLVLSASLILLADQVQNMLGLQLVIPMLHFLDFLCLLELRLSLLYAFLGPLLVIMQFLKSQLHRIQLSFVFLEIPGRAKDMKTLVRSGGWRWYCLI